MLLKPRVGQSKPRYNLLNPGRGKGPINIFFAGAGFSHELLHGTGARKRLLSWHANTKEDLEDVIAHDKEFGDTFLIVDSGAFTVWTKGSKIDVEDYIQTLGKLLDHFDVAANLDVIPGKKGMQASEYTKEITESAANEGWENYLKIEHALAIIGVDAKERVMPIYHQGESMDWLRRMVDYGCQYIGISPSNDYATSQREHWLDDVFDYLSSLSTLPRTHGYAVTSTRLMAQYPWMSVDSASWVMGAGYGTINTPFGQVTLTDRDQTMGRADAMDGRDWSPEMKAKVESYLAQFGLTVEGCRKSHHDRWRANAHYLLEWEKAYQYKPRQKPSGLFDEVQPVDTKPVEKKVELKPAGQIGQVPMSLYDARKGKAK